MLYCAVYIGDVRANDRAELMSINRELLGNTFIKVLFILLFVNQIICLTCGLLGFLRSLLSSAEAELLISHIASRSCMVSTWVSRAVVVSLLRGLPSVDSHSL